MSNLTEIFNAGAANAYLFVPTAVLLGALHGLEPGHSKTMMAAFIVAIRGTVAQAVMFGVGRRFCVRRSSGWSRSRLCFGSPLDAEASEPPVQVASGRSFSASRCG